MSELRLYLAQRLTAAILAPLVLIHLGVMIYAIGDGLTAAEILARTRGSWGWALFYGLFVCAAAIHGAIGLRNILAEWAGLRGPLLNKLSFAVFITLAVLGMRAVVAVVVLP